ncbi:MAG: hypothetical protein KDK91_30905 [Gammaproteobacteria bacterium]|nr:hypothetical protein [Gammaproteobacteria bacterium]
MIRARLSSLFSLAVFSLLAGVIWHTEMALRFGWQGSAWIGSLHYSVPLMSALFAIWTYGFTPLSAGHGQRLKRALLVFFAGLAGYLCFAISLLSLYVFALWGERAVHVYTATVLSAALAVPLVYTFLARHHNPAFCALSWLLAPLGFLLSVPAAVQLLDMGIGAGLLPFDGPASEVLAIRSGLIFPGLFAACGLPFVLCAGSAAEPATDRSSRPHDPSLLEERQLAA